MKNKNKVKFTPSAYKDLDNIYNYIYNTLGEPNIAKKFRKEIEEKILSLSDSPKRFALCREQILRQKGYRKLIIKNYIAFYTVRETNSSNSEVCVKFFGAKGTVTFN